ncbi:hypothetical protein F4820DRAFT_444545 [Hypoxylon rubiginosum]|uniref:Uncharacterized protein n=1 Tax=Hypoxylon rubiginosum TaxID=110542 RepID=A0ACB9ZAR7_9PEZI|nr:hypothetical protein F4820DRAFT_444545 [Hypoxylon rubiginosum]
MPSRGVPPSPLSTMGHSESSHHRQDSFGSYFSDKDKVRRVITRRALSSLETAAHSSLTPSQDGRGSTSSSQFEDYRKMSDTPNRKPHSPTVNVYTHCGRHTDQYLFSGWSSVVKSPFKKH